MKAIESYLACLNVPWKYHFQYDLQKRHRDLCKFARNDEDWDQVARLLRDTADKAIVSRGYTSNFKARARELKKSNKPDSMSLLFF